MAVYLLWFRLHPGPSLADSLLLRFWDAGVPWDTVDLGCDAVGKQTQRPSFQPPCQLLPWARLHVGRLSDWGLRVAEDCLHLHSMRL